MKTRTVGSPRGWRYFARLLGFAGLMLVLILGIGPLVVAWTFSYVVLHPGCNGDLASLEELGYPSEAVQFEAPDGTLRRGWLARGTKYPESVIVVLPGHGGNTRFALPDAVILAEEGYSTLIFEHRSCADSRLIASTGYHEARDLQSAVRYLRTRPDIEHIGVMGESEGGTASVLAAAGEPAIDGVIDMGGYADLTDDILDPQVEHSVPDAVYRRMVIWTMSLQLGVPVKRSNPVGVIAQISPRPVLLVYGESEAAVGQMLFAAAAEPADLWIVPGAGHTGYRWAAPAEYRERITRFFNTAFGITR